MRQGGCSFVTARQNFARIARKAPRDRLFSQLVDSFFPQWRSAAMIARDTGATPFRSARLTEKGNKDAP
jgi:hypothetical protein